MKNSGRLVGGAIAAVIAIALVIAVANGGNGAPDVTFPGGSGTTVAPGGSLPASAEPAEYQAARIQGAPLAPMQDGGPDEAIGAQVPVVDGFDFDGSAVSLDVAASGKPTMLVFLAHWCPHCNAEVPVLLDWKNSGAVPANLNIVGIATAVAPTAPNYPPYQWFSNKGWSWPVLVDQKTEDGVAGVAAQAFGASGWPFFVIIGEDGTVKARGSGEKTIAELQAIVDEALAS